MSRGCPVGQRGVLMTEYIPQNTELSWQKAWDDAKIFNVEFKKEIPNSTVLKCTHIHLGKCTWVTSEIIQLAMLLLGTRG